MPERVAVAQADRVDRRLGRLGRPAGVQQDSGPHEKRLRAVRVGGEHPACSRFRVVPAPEGDIRLSEHQLKLRFVGHQLPDAFQGGKRPLEVVSLDRD